MRLILLLPALLAAALAPGCTLFVSVPDLEPLPERHIRLDAVAYVPQQADWDCGPACLATLLRHHGHHVTLDQVKARLKRAASGGTLWLEMLFGARQNGLRARLIDGDINRLRRRLFGRQPVILMLHNAPDIVTWIVKRQGHYVVAVGYDDDDRELILHTGRSSFATMSYRRLQLQWSRAKFKMLAVEKAGGNAPPSDR